MLKFEPFYLQLGDDVFGRDYLKNFKDNNINTDHVFITNKAATGLLIFKNIKTILTKILPIILNILTQIPNPENSQIQNEYVLP